MLRLDKVIKPWKESAALNDHINLYGFWNETAFLTKSGDVGMILSVPGVDYESLDRSQQEYAVKQLEAALKAFHLNDTELDLIDGLIPPGQMLIRKAQTSKKVHLNVDSVSHWMATNNARDNLKKQEYFDRHGFADGLRHLAEEWPFQPRALAVSTSNTNR